MILYGINGTAYNIKDQVKKSGGEGAIHALLDYSTILAKIYHENKRANERKQKISYMVSCQPRPDSDVWKQIGWPLDMLHDHRGRFVGFLMPYLESTAELNILYQYTHEKAVSTTKQRVRIAMNICATLDTLHNQDIVVGDFNPSNIGVDVKQGYVAFFDADSFHIIDRVGDRAFRCEVGYGGYIAPELLTKLQAPQAKLSTLKLHTFTPYTDNFALAIHVFRLLMNGVTPYLGVQKGTGPLSTLHGSDNDFILQDRYCFKPGFKSYSKLVPPLDTLPDYLRKLVNQAFIDGYRNPKSRPTPKDWYYALEEYSSELTRCSVNPDHYHLKSRLHCAWCKVESEYRQKAGYPPRVTANPHSSKSRSKPKVNLTPEDKPIPIPSYTMPDPNQRAGINQSKGGWYAKVKKIFTENKDLLSWISILGLVIMSLFFIIKPNIHEHINISFLKDFFTSSVKQSQQRREESTINTQPTEVPYVPPELAIDPSTGMLSCPNSYPSRIQAGGTATVCEREVFPILWNNLESTGEKILLIYSGGQINILEGPRCLGKDSWFYVEVPVDTHVYEYASDQSGYMVEPYTGWVSEGDKAESTYILCP